MKPPRLIRARLTDEDFAIWYQYRPGTDSLRWWQHASVALGIMDSDRRDADTMFDYEDCKARYIASAGISAYWSARALGVELAMRAVR
jgi:hypothetical protein